jgi:hypothetical protein
VIFWPTYQALLPVDHADHQERTRRVLRFRRMLGVCCKSRTDMQSGLAARAVQRAELSQLKAPGASRMISTIVFLATIAVICMIGAAQAGR